MHIIGLLNARVAKALQNGLSLSLFFVLCSVVCYPQKTRVSNFGNEVDKRSTIKRPTMKKKIYDQKKDVAFINARNSEHDEFLSSGVHSPV